MLDKPFLADAVNQKVRAPIAQLQAVKNSKPDLFADTAGFLVIGIVKVQPFGIGTAFIDADVAVQEMVGNKNAVKAKGLVGFQRLTDGGFTAGADGPGVQMRLIAEHTDRLSFCSYYIVGLA